MMIGLTTLPGPIQAMATVGLVLVEALLLYVGYGILSQVAKPTIINAIEGDR